MNSFSSYRNQRYFASLDGVRFFSIIAVIWHHATPANLPEFFSRGFLGVDMFFVLSGYLIVTLLLREKDGYKTISLKNFYIRRALRIFPVYFGLLAFLSVVYGLLKSGDPDADTFFSLLPIYLAFLANWSLVHAANLGIYWSLATEEQFYLLWPLLEKWLKPKPVLIFLAIFIVINQCINFGYLDAFFISLYGDEEVINLEILGATFTPICLGVLLAHGLHRQSTFTVVYRWLHHYISSAVFLGLLLLLVFVSVGDLSGIKRLLIQIVMCIWLATLVIREQHILKRLMVFPVVKRLGQISYGMYVYHMIALHIVRELLSQMGIAIDYSLFLLGLALTAFIAECSFRLYETPILSLGKKYRTKNANN